MERTLLRELNKVNLTAYVNRLREAQLKALFWSLFFNLKYTTQLTWESLTGSGGAPVMADVVEYNSSAPIKTRRVVSSAKGDIPKIAIKRKMDEKDLNDYNVMKALAGADAGKNDILDLVFNDVDFVYTGVQARTEFLALQALSYGKISLDATNNNGIITETDVDFGIPSGNKTAVSVTWATAASATPVADIRAKVAAIKAAGHSCQYVVMDEATYLQMIACTELKDAYSFYQGISTGRIAVPALDGVNAMLTAERLPKIVIVDSAVRQESKAHVLSNVSPWKTGYVTFIPQMVVGLFKHGPIAEETSESLKKTAVMTKKDHVLITKWSELEPFGEYTKGQANAFPTFDDTGSLYILKTNGTSWS